MNDNIGSCKGGRAGSCYDGNNGALEVKITVSRVKLSQNDVCPGQMQTIDNANITLLWQLAGHSDWVSSIAFSPDGYTLASGSFDKTIKLWDAQTGDLKRTLVGHDESVTLVTFSPDGRTLASGSGRGPMSMSYDTSVRLWDTQTGDLKNTLKAVDNSYSGVTDITFSPEGSTLAAESFVEPNHPGGYQYSVVKLWDVQSGKTQAIFGYVISGGRWIFSPDGRSFVISSGQILNIVTIWDVRTREPKWTLECVGPTPLIFSPDGKFLAVQGDNKTMQIWDVQTRELKRTLETVGPVIFSPNGKLLADGGGYKTVRLWDAQTWNLLRQLAGHSGKVIWVAFSPDGRTFASRTSDGIVKMWDTEVWEVRQTFEALNRDVTSIDLSPDWRTVIYWNSNGTVSLYDAQTGKMKGLLEEDSGTVREIIFSPDGKTLASRGDGKIVSLWRIK
jgi:WD40 repeat protein